MKIFNFFVLSVLWISLTFATPINSKKLKKIKNGSNDSNDTNGLSSYEQEHINKIDPYLGECTVLLRKNGDFPLRANEKDIYLIGNGVRNTIKGGTGSGDVNSHYFETIEEAFTKAGYNILSKDFLDAYDEIYKKAKEVFDEEHKNDIMGPSMKEPEYDIPYEKKGNVAIYVLSRNSGEGSDRTIEKGDVLLTDVETKIIKDLAAGYRKFILVLNTGGPVDLSDLDSVKNILILSQLGVNTSKALVDIIRGDKYPSGKLATTWTKVDDYQIIGDFGDNNDTNYKEGIYVGYRYFDTKDIDVMFPFGFGLGYTNFKLEAKSAKLSGEQFKVDVNVKNVGKFKGKEVIQLYLSKPNTKLAEPYQILVTFDKTKELGPGKKDTLHLKFKLSDFASYDTKSASYILDKGTYIVRYGNSSRNTKPCGKIVVKSRIVTKQLKNKLGKPDFEDYTAVSSKKDSKKDLAKVPTFTLKASSIKKVVEAYDKVYNIPKEVKALSTEDKARLVTGDFGSLESESIIGNASYSVAGAAGQTYSVDGLKSVIMADGPAGIRLAKDYYVDESGVHSLAPPFGSTIPLEAPEGVTVLHQYATAIPIGTAIAQSWNKKFAEVLGDVVGAEMEKFNVNLWLAPALNIHRSILCGRNFEYYSEDPVISGSFAAALTKSVQKHKNAYVTLKHFAANNQETNRYLNSSNVSERAMREIYLKGFEICIREANPKAIMTSYNLINGVHTSESKELTNDILRNEFDFNGIVMTDWVFDMNIPNAKYSSPTSNNVIKASGDIYMPGSKKDYNRVLEAIENGNLTMEELEMSAARIYNLAKEIEN